MRRQRGVVAIEFALVFLFGLLPLLLLTLSGVLIFAAKQSLTLAAAEGARAALRYSASDADRGMQVCKTAQHSMQWLLTFSGETAPCAANGIGTSIAVSTPFPCDSAPTVQCMKVETSFDYNEHPFVPGTTSIYHWLMQGSIQSSATVQLDTQGS